MPIDTLSFKTLTGNMLEIKLVGGGGYDHLEVFEAPEEGEAQPKEVGGHLHQLA